MALVNHAKREINAKLVFYGPALSGKGTNLNYIYRKLKPEHRGKLKVMNIEKDRMLFFDFAPAGQGKVGTYNVRFHIYSIIGDSTSGAAWKMVLKGADGVVFVADSAPDRLCVNIESLNSLQKTLTAYAKNFSDLPGVLQCNKRDLPAVLSLEEMQKSLNPGRYPVIPAVANKGEGVLESLYSLMKTVLKNLRESGLELDKEPEQLAGGRAEPHGMEQVSYGAVTDSPTIPVGAREAGIMAPASAEGKTGTADSGEPLIELAGEPELLAGGRLRLPLNFRYGKWEKKMAVTVSVSLEPDQEIKPFPNPAS
jgi:signal recognition particle receptor subunit beta